tara:strand:- start:241 stop:624 length:384 start_codon:yes stop_codon:yes gene_type:complete
MTLEQFQRQLEKQGTNLDAYFSKNLRSVSKKLRQRAQLQATIDPKVRSGDLYRSIESKIKSRTSEVEIVLSAGSDSVKYAAPIEFGTKDGRLYPRLFLDKAVKLQQQRMPKFLKLLLKKVLDGQNAR